jgi:predicted metal-dependent peptidase
MDTDPTPPRPQDWARTIEAAKVQLAASAAFAPLAGLLHATPAEASDAVLNAATDGVRTLWNPGFVQQLTQTQTNFVLAHETLHQLLRHLWLYRALWDEDSARANQAMDYVVNQLIVEADPKREVVDWRGLPVRPLLDKAYAGLSVSEVYRCLKASPRRRHPPYAFDLHDVPGAARHTATPEQRRALEQRLRSAMQLGRRTARQLHGQGSGTLDRLVEALLEGPAVDWRQELASFLSATVGDDAYASFARPNRRWLAQGLYLPSRRAEGLVEVVVAIDTSGSIGEDELRDALGQVRALLEALAVQRLHLVYWDDGVARHEIYDDASADALTYAGPRGGGGTTFAPVLDYLQSSGVQPQCLIAFTDGHITDWGEPPSYPVLWVVSGDAPCPWGHRVSVSVARAAEFAQ